MRLRRRERHVSRAFAWIAVVICSLSWSGGVARAVDPTEIPDLIRKLEFPINPESRRVGLQGLLDLKEKAAPAIPHLIRLSKSDDPKMRMAAMVVLASIGPASKAALADLRPRLKDDDLHVRYWACQAIGAIGPEAKTVVPELLEAMKSDAASVRRHAALALGKIGREGGEQMIAPLITALKDKSNQVRADAAQSLGLLGPMAAAAVRPLELALEDPNFHAKANAAVAHWRITGQTDLALKHLLAELRQLDNPWDAVTGYIDMGDAARAAVPELEKLAAEEEGELQLYAVEALGGIGKSAERAIPVLQKLATDDQPDEDLRDAAREAIKKIRP